MTRRIVLFLSAAAFAAAADTSWDKVKDLKSGAEVRIYEVGKPTPVEATLGEVRDDDIVIIVKNEQKAVRKDLILRLDARPKSKRPVTPETKTTIDRGVTPGPPQGKPTEKPNIPGQSYSGGLTIGSKAAYETIYRKGAHTMESAPQKQ